MRRRWTATLPDGQSVECRLPWWYPWALRLLGFACALRGRYPDDAALLRLRQHAAGRRADGRHGKGSAGAAPIPVRTAREHDERAAFAVTTVGPPPRRVLPVIVRAQFGGTSLWFAVDAAIPDLQRGWQLPAAAVGHLTSAVPLGFVAGTLVFALLTIADRHSPRLVFLLCALAGAACNVAGAVLHGQFDALRALRFATGFFLAGIYPVGMKIAASGYTRGRGAALGPRVGARWCWAPPRRTGCARSARAGPGRP